MTVSTIYCFQPVCRNRFSPGRAVGMIVAFAAGLILAGFGVTNSKAQTVTIQGIVTDTSTDLPLEEANVLLQNMDYPETLKGDATDRHGYYRIVGLEPGRYAIRISYIGYTAYEDTLDLGDVPEVTVNAALELDEELLGQVFVEWTRGAARRDAGMQRIRSADIDRIPTPGGVGDLAGYLQSLPGVVAIGDRGGQLFIRGGTPSQNLVLIDGTVIYQPFHILGFFSAFPEELISGADFYAGGFSPRYNSRISSVLDVQMRDGDRTRHNATASISPFLGEVYLEGPFKKGSTSWIASGRGSLIERTSPWYLDQEYPLGFDSQFFRVSHTGSDNSRCSALALRTSDRGRMDFESDDVLQWNNFVLGGRCLTLPNGTSRFLDIHMGVSHMSNAAGDRKDPELTSRITRFNLDVNITQYSGELRFDYGMFGNMKFFNFEMSELFQTPRTDSDATLGAGSHLEVTIPVGERTRVQTGGLLSVHGRDYSPKLEPRLRATFQPFGRDDEELSASIGLYRQALIGLSDMRDANSVFVAWAPPPPGEPQLKSINAVVGWQQTLGRGFQYSIETFYKRLQNLPITVWSTLARFTTELTQANGRVYGSDVRLEYNRGRFYGLAGYGYSWTEYESAQDHFNIWFGEPVQRFHPPHDRRHQINTMFSLDLGRYTAGLRWQFGSGVPFTRPMGFDELFLFDERLPDVRESYGTPRVILEKPFQGRMPAFHRLDVSLERSFNFSLVELTLQTGVINTYDQANMFYFDVFTQRRIDQLHVAPYLSLKMTTR